MRLTGVEWMRLVLSLSLASVFSFLIVFISSPNVEGQPESINVQNTVVTAPLTVVVPITADVQNAQICVSAASSGDQSCTQAILNPEQTAYTPVSADLTQSETPTVSSTVQQEPSPAAEPATTTAAETPTTTDSKQAPSTSPETTTEPSVTDEQPLSESQSPEETSDQEVDNNDNPDDATTTEEKQEPNSEGSSGGE
jgi:hypothetical protein